MDESERFDPDLLDDEDPFEVDDQLAHLFKHAALGLADVHEVWESGSALLPGRPAGALAHGG